MGRDAKNTMEMEGEGPKSQKKAPKIRKNPNAIKKAGNIPVPRKAKMEEENDIGEVVMNFDEGAVGRPTKKTRVNLGYTPRPDYKPSVFKDFNKLYDLSVSQSVASTKTMSKGQKQRVLKNQKVGRRKTFAEYLKKLKEKKKEDAIFDLGLFNDDMLKIENNVLEELKQREQDTHKGVSSNKKSSVANEEILRTQKILQHGVFLKDPFATMRLHIENTIHLKEEQEAKLKASTKKNEKKPKNKMETE